MELKTIILSSEEEFRNYIISNSSNIYKFIIFEDALNNVIFFYCFDKNRVIISTKEYRKNFSFFKNKYLSLAKDLFFATIDYSDHLYAIKLSC